MSQEQERDPRGEEEIDTNRVVILAADSFKVEDHFEQVRARDDRDESERYAPQDEIDPEVYVEELRGGRGGQTFPHDCLAADPETDTE